MKKILSSLKLDYKGTERMVLLNNVSILYKETKEFLGKIESTIIANMTKQSIANHSFRKGNKIILYFCFHNQTHIQLLIHLQL